MASLFACRVKKYHNIIIKVKFTKNGLFFGYYSV